MLVCHKIATHKQSQNTCLDLHEAEKQSADNKRGLKGK